MLFNRRTFRVSSKSLYTDLFFIMWSVLQIITAQHCFTSKFIHLLCFVASMTFSFPDNIRAVTTCTCHAIMHIMYYRYNDYYSTIKKQPETQKLYHVLKNENVRHQVIMMST